MKMVKVSLNGNTYEYPEGTRYLEIAADMQKSYPHDIVLVSANKRLQMCIRDRDSRRRSCIST